MASYKDLTQDEDFLSLFESLHAEAYCKDYLLWHGIGSNPSIAANSADGTAADMINFISRNLMNNESDITIIKIIKHFMLMFYIACKVWDQVRLHKLKYNSSNNDLKLAFDNEYWHNDLSNSVMTCTVSRDNDYYIIKLALKPEIKGLDRKRHIVLSFKMNKKNIDREAYYLNAIEIEFWSQDLSLTNYYNINALTMKDIQEGIDYITKKVY